MIFAEDWKFRKSAQEVSRIIESKTLWFSTPDHFNDPFDCQVDIAGTFEAVKSLLPIHHNTQITEIIEGARLHAETHKYAYFCACGTWDETLMWSHYADSHKGIALGFSFSTDSPFNFRELNYKPVVYSSFALKEAITRSNDALNMYRAYPRQTPGLMAGEADNIFQMFRYHAMELYEAIRFMKAECWKYEQERRYEIELSSGIGIARAYKPEDLKHVIFGVACHERDVEAVRKLFAGEEWRHVQFWMASPDAINLKLKASRL
jgi:hypothetical protein